MFRRPTSAIRMLYQDKLLSRSFLFIVEAHQVLYIHIPTAEQVRTVRVPYYIVSLRNLNCTVVLDFRFEIHFCYSLGSQAGLKQQNIN
jgi:hypothetical protein